ncbi:MAG TPA: 50S ribosomal protein L30 [Solirubrobacteraceae bacterium]|nr:50S ribosomal protein L30 [Solirubrobacteraceae bacterium]
MRITQYKSKNGADQRQLDTLRSLGLHRIGQVVEVQDTPQARGMIHRVRHLVRIVEEQS